MKKLFALLAGLALATGALTAQIGPGPGPGVRPELPAEVKAMIDAYRAEQVALRTELKAVIDAIENPTRELVAEATKAFREENAERLAAQRELGQDIREALAAARPERPALPPEVQALVDSFKAKQAELREAQMAFRASLANATEEERAALIAAHREAQQARLDELKDLRRQIRDARRGG